MRLADEAATEALGRQLGERARPGDVLALLGDLGAGKSVLARGVARGLGVRGRVPSPTFIIAQVYEDARLPLVHADLYRLDDPAELDQLGLDELIGGSGVAVVEWADRFPELLPADTLTLRLRPDGAGRVVEATAGGPRARALWEGLGG